MADAQSTVVGNLTADPELRFTPSGHAVANFTIAANHRVKKGDQWEDGEPTFYRCTIWREYAENVAESLTKGMQVLASGRLYTEAYETREGEKRTSLKLDVDEIGPSLRYATARVTKVDRRNNGGGGFSGGQQSQQQGFGGQQNDPWSGGQQQSQGSWDTPANSAPPF